MDTFSLLVAALEIFNRYSCQHVRYTLLDVRMFGRAWKAQKKGLSCDTRHCRQMDALSWQHPMSHCSLRHRIVDLKRHSCGSRAPYPPDLSPCDFLLFPKLKNVLKGRHFETLENTQKCVTDMLKIISVEDFQRCYQQWEQRLHGCVAAQGNYFERDNIDVWVRETLVNKKSVSLIFCHTSYTVSD